ncbi:M20 aminoacylase family protein [Oceanicella actignis]|uniref:Hippurate hydrolase n=1 Tax=Oceanicella actignis TaxID=1189325 RepID=A0A1M7SGW8_9RHOB|nr:M20 aminoacylase family protein [Oceanicella actignis]SET20522.1 hippurate hydrolase [Oceanicella actignis]SHN57728.1 hippurate hydrolase [Oceanicella actignis]
MPARRSLAEEFASEAQEIAAWRRELHMNPELGYDLPRTAAFVADKLRAFGCDEVVEGIGRSGVVGLIRGAAPGPSMGLRADMDALPILEASGAPWASRAAGRMHACGHDGHTAMLLGAARRLARERDFAGRVAVIFQPAEEGGAGALAMVRDGLMERFEIAQVFGMHNLPGAPEGAFLMRPGPIMAASDQFDIAVEGRGGHAALPHACVDPVLTAAHVAVALQGVVSRAVDPLEPAVVSVTGIAAEGEAYNVIPARARLRGTARSLSEPVRALLEARVHEVARNVAAAYGAEARVDWTRGYPVTVNAPAPLALAARAARDVAGAAMVDEAAPPLMGAEDFAYMLEARPGAFIFIGAGDSAPLHNPAYDFNDRIIPAGCAYWLALTRRALPPHG